MRNIRFVSTIIAVGLTLSCEKKVPTSDVNIDNGLTLNQLSPNTARGVVWVGNCSATIVSDTTLVTAAHCVESLPRNSDESVRGRFCVSSGYAAGKCVDKVYVPNGYYNGGPLKMAYDIAVAVFPNSTFQDYHEVETTKPKIGNELVFAGYSPYRNGQDVGAEPTKRWGRNRISSFLSTDITIVSTGSGELNGVAVSPGDSGGPAFRKCKLLGVASRMSEGDVKRSLHTNVTYPGVTTWFQGLKAKGAHLCGYHEKDAARCDSAKLITESTSANAGDVFPCAVSVAGTSTPDSNDNIVEPKPDISAQPTNPSVPSTSPNANKCACGVAPNRYGVGCVVERVSPKAGQVKLLVQSGSSSMCQTAEQCLFNYGDYLKNKDYCPEGWFFGKATDQSPQPANPPSGGPSTPGPSTPGPSTPGPSTPGPSTPGPSTGSGAVTPPSTTFGGLPLDNGPSRVLSDAVRVSFERDVRPILKARCAECHHSGSHVDISTVDNASRKNLMAKVLFSLTTNGAERMPPAPREKLSDAEIETIRKWIGLSNES